MYMINREYGMYLLNKYDIDYALNGPIPYNPDWIITKPDKQKRALVYPMLAVEEGVNLSSDVFQNDFHTRCYITNYNIDMYL